MSTTIDPGLHPVLATQVRTQVWWWDFRSRAAGKLREERGDVYSNTIMIAIAVVIAITVGGILLTKFTDKAESIDTDTPAGAVSP
jgi:hypothetical protein